MNSFLKLVNFLVVFLHFIDTINSVELTFELPDNSKECFYQEITKNKSAVLEFQVSFEGKFNFKIFKYLMTRHYNFVDYFCR